MSAPDGRLSKEQKEIAIQWIEKKSPQLRCASCHSNHFGVGDHLFSPPIFVNGGTALGAVSYPQFFIVCQNCSHLMMFSAVLSGLVPSSDQKTDKEQGEP